ncbi:MAG: hypothetical protein SCH71_16560 [Desulfobulbaceae bacterium]|nr:hypothetical protein [Desulfobulbaceae bacterium]
MKFHATVSSRSSKCRGGPPGESEILSLNPQRVDMILKITGWNNLVSGTLNLEVKENVVDDLLSREPTYRELGETVNYPEPFQHIPMRRLAYLYFKGTIYFRNASEDVLFRTAENPIKSRIEAFAAVKLRESLGLSDEDQIKCEIFG